MAQTAVIHPPLSDAPQSKPSWFDTPDWVNIEIEVGRATYEAYQILYYSFIVLMAIVGFDKFLHVIATWETYVSPSLVSSFHMSAGAITGFAGLIELLIAAAVALKPRVGSWAVTVWLWLIVLNLLTIPGHYDTLFLTAALSAAGFAFIRLSAECN